jgi:hypothetical protein
MYGLLFTLKMEAVQIPETLMHLFQAIVRHIAKKSTDRSQLSEAPEFNLFNKSCGHAFILGGSNF